MVPKRKEKRKKNNIKNLRSEMHDRFYLLDLVYMTILFFGSEIIMYSLL
jgi:uncharacterized protein with PhoU and TrkA domain